MADEPAVHRHDDDGVATLTLARPEPQALWRRRLPDGPWRAADATFDGESDRWRRRKGVRDPWQMRHGDLRFELRLTPFRHTGLFPEQAVNWQWMHDLIVAARRPIRLLNLFAYTGLATLAAARAGAEVTHVDASKPAMAWARQNQTLSNLEAAPIRWLLDDALKFVQREARRGNRYDGIMLDPPAYGRGPKGELWRFSEGFPTLMEALRPLLSDRPLLLLVNAYSITESPLVLHHLVDQLMANHGGTVSSGELALRESGPDGRLLPTSLFARWSGTATRDGNAERRTQNAERAHSA